MLTARIRDALLPIFAVGGLIRILFLLGPRDLVLISCMASFLFRIKHTTTPSSSFRGIDTLLFCLPTHSSFFPIPSALSFFVFFYVTALRAKDGTQKGRKVTFGLRARAHRGKQVRLFHFKRPPVTSRTPQRLIELPTLHFDFPFCRHLVLSIDSFVIRFPFFFFPLPFR